MNHHALHETIRSGLVYAAMIEAESERNRLISFASLLPDPGDSMRRWQHARDLHIESCNQWDEILQGVRCC